jgi:hypothetical protein
MGKLRICLGSWLLLCVVSGASASPVTLESSELASLRNLVKTDKGAAEQFAKVRETADAAMAQSPDPIPVIISEGHLDNDPKKVRSTAAMEDFEKVEALAWSWAVSQDDKYAAKARDYLMAWARTNRSDGNPINETKLESLVEGYDLLRPTFTPTNRDVIDKWLLERAKKTWSDPRGHSQNWQSHRLKIVGLIAATTGDTALWSLVDTGFRQHIANDFHANGESTDFERRDAIHYHLYTVNPLLTVACVAERRKNPLFTYRAPSGASLQMAVEFIEPFALGKKKHVEFANTKSNFDRERATAGQGEFKQHAWNPKLSVRTFSEAGCIEPSFNAIAAKINGDSKAPYMNWRAVLNAALEPQQGPKR